MQYINNFKRLDSFLEALEKTFRMKEEFREIFLKNQALKINITKTVSPQVWYVRLVKMLFVPNRKIKCKKGNVSSI
jgi:hypothetical protein